MSDTVTVTLTCPKCGSPPQYDRDLGDDAPVTCSNPECDTRFGTWGEVKAQATKKVKDQVTTMYRDGLKKALRGTSVRVK